MDKELRRAVRTAILLEVVDATVDHADNAINHPRLCRNLLTSTSFRLFSISSLSSLTSELSMLPLTAVLTKKRLSPELPSNLSTSRRSLAAIPAPPRNHAKGISWIGGTDIPLRRHLLSSQHGDYPGSEGTAIRHVPIPYDNVR